MTTAQVVETSVTVNKNSPIQDYVHPDDHTQPTLQMIFPAKEISHFTLYYSGPLHSNTHFYALYKK